MRTLRLVETAGGHPYHAAFVRLGGSRVDATIVHKHADFVELFCVVAGSGLHLVDGEPLPLRAGDLTFVRADDVHQLLAPPRADMHLVNISMPTETWSNVVAVGAVTTAAVWEAADRPTTVHLTGSHAAEVAAAHRLALRAFITGPTRLDLLKFLSAVLPILAAHSVERPEADGRPGWLVRACAAMEQPENMRLGLRRLLELASVSHAHLDRSMRRHYGTTPTRFVSDLRLRRAAMLLASTSETASAISVACGFSSQSYFSRCFTEAHGVSPRAFRAEARAPVAPPA